jgi:putative transposase
VATLSPPFRGRTSAARSIFIHDRLANGRNVRAIAVVDDFTRECLALEIGFSFGSHDVIRCFEDLAFERGFPETIRFDNGSEFASHAMLRWGAERRSNSTSSIPVNRPKMLKSNR